MARWCVLAASLFLACSACEVDEGDEDDDEDALPPEVTLACPEVPDLRAAPSQGFFAHYTRLEAVKDVPKPISGPFADVVVNVGDAGGQLVFSRATSYRPVWRTADEVSDVPHISPVQGQCDALGRFDLQNAYSFARILEANESLIRVGWRYFPDLSKLAPGDVVHEIYEIRPDGSVTRVHRAGTSTITAWNDPAHRTVQALKLGADGVTVETLSTPSRSVDPEPVVGAPIVSAPALEADRAWRFDEGQGTQGVSEDGGGRLTIAGQGAPWRPGLSGNALAFDGYTAVAEGAQGALPSLTEGFTMSGWLALGAWPWSDAPLMVLVHEDTPEEEDEDDTGPVAPFLGVRADGTAVARFGDVELFGESQLPLSKWTHLAMSFDGVDLVLYVNGQEVGRDDVGRRGPVAGGLRLGLSATARPAAQGVRAEDTGEFHHFASVTGLEGLIDEVRVHGKALTGDEVEAMFDALAQAATDDPALMPRVVPSQAGQPADAFGVSTAPLGYHDLWDDLWRVAEGDDVVVKFDRLPGSVVYWRGTVHGVNMVADEGRWMTDQSVEMIIPDIDDPPILTLAEHMSDKAARRSHVRIIEQTDARVVIHWRYAEADVFDNLLHQRAFTDEVHTIYPDGVLIRDVFFHLAAEEQGLEFYHDFQVLLGPGQRAEDTVPLTALTYANLKGETRDLEWPLPSGVEEMTAPLSPANIIRINFEGDWKVFGVAQGGTHYPAGGGHEISPFIDYDGEEFPFAGPWNHWPAAQIPSDGRYALDDDRIAHFALGSSEPQEHGTGSMLYGLTDDASMGHPVTVARAWIRPPSVDGVSGAQSQGYDTDQRAYTFAATGDDMALTLQGSDERPVFNPALVVADWPDDQPVTVLVDGQRVEARQGMTRDAQGRRQLVVFLFLERTDAVTIRLSAP